MSQSCARTRDAPKRCAAIRTVRDPVLGQRNYVRWFALGVGCCFQSLAVSSSSRRERPGRTLNQERIERVYCDSPSQPNIQCFDVLSLATQLDTKYTPERYRYVGIVLTLSGAQEVVQIKKTHTVYISGCGLRPQIMQKTHEFVCVVYIAR